MPEQDIIYNTTIQPYSSVVRIVATFSDGSRAQGSGVVIGANDVLTAAHVVTSENGYATRVEIVPAYNDGYRPFGTYTADRIQAALLFDGSDRIYWYEIAIDFALLTLNDPIPIGQSTGWLDITPGGLSKPGDVASAGYPAVNNGELLTQISGYQYINYYGNLSGFSVGYDLGGISGGPIWIEGPDGTRTVIGLESSTGQDFYIDKGAYLQIKSWAASNDAPDIRGTFGDDTLVGSGQNDTIQGFGGDDRLQGYRGDDALFGNAGADTLNGGSGHDVLGGGDGSDLIFGSEGADWLRGAPGDDTLKGGDGRDTVEGGQGDDRLFAGRGTDQVRGHGGDDAIWGGADGDTILGGDGDDTIRGEAGGDLIRGGDGADILRGGAGFDTLIGGAGADRFEFLRGDADLLGIQGEGNLPGFRHGADLIVFIGGPTSFEDLSIGATSAASAPPDALLADVIISQGATLIFVANADASDFTADDFLFL